jgi:hypothetical protein
MSSQVIDPSVFRSTQGCVGRRGRDGVEQAGEGSGRVDGWNQYGRALACSDEMNGGLQNRRRRGGG